MSDATETHTDTLAKPSKRPLIIGLVLALVGAGGGYFAVTSQLIPGLGHGEVPAKDAKHTADEKVPALGDIAFVDVPPMVISLGPGARADHLRFRASLEVPGPYQDEVIKLLPRVQDVMNSYLRALEPDEIEEKAALLRLRSQMLRRVKLVAGEGRVTDLLVLEFVLS